MKISHELSLDELCNYCDNRLKQFFLFYLPNVKALLLKEAMQTALLNGGKHLRPLLVYATAAIFNTPWENADIPAAAIELIHTYSLIHDDLPSMDNADFRRGKPACHKIYGEGMAVLTGDALQTLAMQILAAHPSTLRANARLEMLTKLSEAAGPYGMAAGQALDISIAGGTTPSPDLMSDIYRLKTGALFSASIQLGYIAAQQEDEFNAAALLQFGELIGLAFQIQDDILDIEGDADLLGKPQQIDIKNNKLTFPTLFGLETAKEKVGQLYEEALETIKIFGQQGQLLRELTQSMLQRKK